MRIKVIPYDPIHAYTIIERNVREIDLHLRGHDIERIANGWRSCGPAFTLIVDDEVVACAGITILMPGVGEAWSLLSTLFYKYPKTSFKEMKQGLDAIIRGRNLRRVQSLVYKGFDRGCHLLEHLGFKCETPDGMINIGPNGETMLMFGRGC